MTNGGGSGDQQTSLSALRAWLVLGADIAGDLLAQVDHLK